MQKCLTRPCVLTNVSGCLVEKPECGYAHTFGFSIVCRHPRHTTFYAHTAGLLTSAEALKLYDELRKKRRAEFIANLDEAGRRIFTTRIDFFGQASTPMDMNEKQQSREEH